MCGASLYINYLTATRTFFTPTTARNSPDGPGINYSRVKAADTSVRRALLESVTPEDNDYQDGLPQTPAPAAPIDGHIQTKASHPWTSSN